MVEIIRGFSERNVPEELSPRNLLRKEIPELIRILKPLELMIVEVWVVHLAKNPQLVQGNNVAALKDGFVARLKRERLDALLASDKSLFQNLIKDNVAIDYVDAVIFISNLVSVRQAHQLDLIAEGNKIPEANTAILNFLAKRATYIKALHMGDNPALKELEAYSDPFDMRIGNIFREIVELHRATSPSRPLPNWTHIDRYAKQGMLLPESQVKVPALEIMQLRFKPTKSNNELAITDFYGRFFDIPEEITEYEISRLYCGDIDVLLHNLKVVYALKLQDAYEFELADPDCKSTIVKAPTSGDIDRLGGIAKEDYRVYLERLQKSNTTVTQKGPYMNWFNAKLGIPAALEIAKSDAISVSI